MMPDAVLRRFALGQHLSKIIAVPKDALRWSTRFNAATEANQGKYEVNSQGILIEKATGTWPHFGYGRAFAHIDPSDPQAAYKIMYNFFRTAVQWDDIDVFINFFWSLFKGKVAGRNPWNSNTLDWTTTSPAPHGNFEVEPVVYRWPYDYGDFGTGDNIPQTDPRKDAPDPSTHGH